MFRVGIDVKDERTPLDIETVEQLCAKGLGLAIDKYVIVSTSGFTDPAREEARRLGVEAIRLRSADVARVFALQHIEFTTPVLHNVNFLFRDAGNPPPLDHAPEAWIELENRSDRLGLLPGPYIDQQLRQNPTWDDGEVRTVRVIDENGHWKACIVDGNRWDPPAMMDVTWSATKQIAPGHRFATDTGSEAFTAVLATSNGMRQVTLVTEPAKGGGITLAITFADATPSRTTI